MAIIDQLLAEAKQNQSAAQVPVVQNVNAAVSTAKAPKKDDLAALVKEQAEAIAALRAELSKRNAAQVPAAVPATPVAPVVLTHLSHYEAGVNKRGKAYPAGYKWHAKAFPVGTNPFGGVSIDTLFQIRDNYGKGKEMEFFKEIDSVLANDAIVSTTMAYQRLVAQKNAIPL